MNAFSPLLRRLSWLTGMMFQGQRDLYKTFGYTKVLSYDAKLAKYLRQDIAGRVVDAPAAALWTNPPQVLSSNDEWNRAWGDLVARHNLFAALERADKLAGIGMYSIIVIGFADGGDLETPVNPNSLNRRQEKILYLQPYSERAALIQEYERNSRSPDFMKPKIYQINPQVDQVLGIDTSNNRRSNRAVASLSPFRVHASRVLHIAENVMENEVFGFPRIERVYNVLDDILKVTGGSAETFWLTANRGIHVNVDKDLELDPEDAKELSAEVEEYVHNLRRIIRTRGVDVENLGSDIADPRGAFEVLISILSGATGIPRRILTGSEAGQLASEQDRANWAERIDERRQNWANPYVLFPLIKKLSKVRYLPSTPDMTITVVWPSAFKLSPLEFAQSSAQHARSATNFAKAIETMEKLKRGEPGSEAQLDEEGNPIPGTENPGTPGVDVGDLVTVDEARRFMGLDAPKVTFDSGEDVGSGNNGTNNTPAAIPPA